MKRIEEHMRQAGNASLEDATRDMDEALEPIMNSGPSGVFTQEEIKDTLVEIDQMLASGEQMLSRIMNVMQKVDGDDKLYKLGAKASLFASAIIMIKKARDLFEAEIAS